MQPVDEWARGWHHAVALLRHLREGGQPAQLSTALRVGDQHVYADVPLVYARFYGMNVEYGQSSMFAWGGPLFMAAAYTSNAVSNANARNRAAREAAPQWREHTTARTVVTGDQTACLVNGQWLAFSHSAVVELGADLSRYTCLLTFGEVEPVMLHGSAAPYVAVLLSYLLYGPGRLETLPFLEPLRPVPPAPSQITPA